jgi:predicted transcriptional regulator
MAVKFPCEMVTWFFLPALRKELVLYLIKKKKMKRKEVAELLGLTEAAVCQYLKNKRGSKFKLRGLDLEKIHELGDVLAETASEKDLISGACSICKHLRSKLSLCALHAKQNPNLKGCTICWAGHEAEEEEEVEEDEYEEEDLFRPWGDYAG